MKHLLLTLVITVLNVSIVDSDGDTTKSVILIPYSDGTMDRLVVDKKLLENPETLDAVDKIVKVRLEKKHGF